MKKIVALIVVVAAGLVGFQYMSAAMEASELKAYIRHTLNADTPGPTAAKLIRDKATDMGIELADDAIEIEYSGEQEVTDGHVAGKVSKVLKVMRITAVATVDYDRKIFFWNKPTTLTETVIFNSTAIPRGARHY